MTVQAASVQKQCPRCGQGFICHHGAVSACQCRRVALTPLQQTFLARRYDDCLCRTCLEALRVGMGDDR